MGERWSVSATKLDGDKGTNRSSTFSGGWGRIVPLLPAADCPFIEEETRSVQVDNLLTAMTCFHTAGWKPLYIHVDYVVGEIQSSEGCRLSVARSSWAVRNTDYVAGAYKVQHVIVLKFVLELNFAEFVV